ncbi:peptidase U32 family protein [Culicoidibacter larvae]|uniref:U32 family peptidase n=1 Tax=Culicoidibacter larvae TaxID=2579976 RepID=A0A5R8QDD6_9FIRM|nr:peptidase U32 family protein [Culicoidibacter larvae]TLG74276.1 U32 family peptidase [Culicoidibacter larvae]
MKTTELVLSPPSLTNINIYFDAGADAVIIGEQQFGLRLPIYVENYAEIQALIKQAHAAQKKCYVAINSIIHNHQLDDLKAYIQVLMEVKPDAIIFGDPAVYMTCNELASDIPLFWSTETTATNWFSAKMWFERGIQRVILAKELTLDAIAEMKDHVDGEIEIQGYGALCMFQSRRTLLQNYYNHDGQEEQLAAPDDKLSLYDAERSNYYPIYEDANGTHIMSAKDICVIDELIGLQSIDSIQLNGLLKTEAQMVAVVEAFNEARQLLATDIDSYKKMRKDLFARVLALQTDYRTLDKGFLYKPTIY